MTTRNAGNKYILGWIRLNPENRESFVALANEYANACRAEEGCLFFEMVPHHENEDTIVLAKCFVSEEAHLWHQEQEHFKTMVGAIGKLCLSGHFENVIAASVSCDDPIFA
jgi:quinol monooxygenase YgiN